MTFEEQWRKAIDSQLPLVKWVKGSSYEYRFNETPTIEKTGRYLILDGSSQTYKLADEILAWAEANQMVATKLPARERPRVSVEFASSADAALVYLKFK